MKVIEQELVVDITVSNGSVEKTLIIRQDNVFNTEDEIILDDVGAKQLIKVLEEFLNENSK